MSPDADELVVPLADLSPTQYCLSAGKLRGVLAWFDADAVDDPDHMEPVSVAKVDDELFLLDGHTRAVCALLAGAQRLPAIDETADVDLDIYETCREWCVQRDVESIHDLVGELWSEERYEDEWIGRCHDAFAED